MWSSGQCGTHSFPPLTLKCLVNAVIGKVGPGTRPQSHEQTYQNKSFDTGASNSVKSTFECVCPPLFANSPESTADLLPIIDDEVEIEDEEEED